MPPALRDDCVACHKPFRPNRTLVSVPSGRRIAFDPAQERVWRICSHCGEWNLLGPEASAAALPELRTRFRATASEGTQGIALTELGQDLELLRIGEQAELVAGAIALGDRRVRLRRIGAIAAAVAVGGTALLILLATTGLLGAMGIGVGLSFVGGSTIAQEWRRRRLGLRWRGAHTAGAAIILATGTLTYALGGPDGFLANLGLCALMALLGGALGEMVDHAVNRVALPSGRRIRSTRSGLQALMLQWSAADNAVCVRTPDGVLLDAADSMFVLTHLTSWLGGLPSATIDQAHALVSTTGSLGELLRVLPGTDANGTGHIRLDDLPQTYWVALDLALTRQARDEVRVESVGEAIRVAAIAESLSDDGE